MSLSPCESGEYKSALRAAERNISRLAARDAPNRALKAAYSQVLRATERASEKALENALRTAVEERSRYYAERIARTEISRAWGDGFLAKHRDDPLVVAFRWRLNSRHPVFDICDLHARVDFYGLGAGVYPKQHFPARPAHPHCMCGITPVYEGQLDMGPDQEQALLAGARFDAQAGDRYLHGLERGARMRLLGVDGAQAWQRGADWRSYARGWLGHVDDKGRLIGVVASDKIKARELPDKVKAPDSALPKQLQYGPNAKKAWLPADAVITDVYVIAGHGTSKVLRNATRLAEKHGGSAEEWGKKVGKVVSDLYEYDVHWYEHPIVGAHDHKAKAWKERGGQK